MKYNTRYGVSYFVISERENRTKYMIVNENRASKRFSFFGVEDFFINFDSKNWYENEFENNNEKSCSRSRIRVSRQRGSLNRF